MIASLFIIAASSALFLYWFRYSCLLILAQRQEATVPDYALKVIGTIRLSFPQLEQSLQADSEPMALDTLREGLSNDYRILIDLLQQFSGGDSFEHRILLLDFELMRRWYSLSRRFEDATRARKALTEMSQILGYFASEIGESAAL